MNIDHIETFIYVVHLKSIRKASKALFLSQPTVTARIKSLEKELNTQLFLRDDRELLLTEQGERFIPFAQKILKTIKEGKLQLEEATMKAELNIGSNEITAQYFLSDITKWWENREEKINLTVAATDVIVKALIKQEIDVAFIKKVKEPAIIQKKVLSNPIKLVVYPNHPLIRKMAVTAESLAQEKLVYFECGAFDWKLLRKLFEVEQLTPNIKYEVNQLTIAKNLIKQRLCIGFLPLLCIEEELKNGDLIALETEHLVQLEQDIYLTYLIENKVQDIQELIAINK